MDFIVLLKVFFVIFLAVLAAQIAFAFIQNVVWRFNNLRRFYNNFSRNKESSSMSKLSVIFLLGVAILSFAPEHALASGAIADFATPLQKVLDTITGPIGKIIAVAGVLICGVVLTMRNEEISEGMKGFLKVVFGICFIALATNIVDAIFSFSGAVI